MRIAKIWKNDYPWDVRVEKICKSLAAADHEVHLICANSNGNKQDEKLDTFFIHRLKPMKNVYLNKMSSLPFIVNPMWFKRINEIVRNYDIEVILVRDLPLTLTSLLIGRKYCIPVIFDMAENYPAMWREIVERGGWKIYNHLLKNPTIAEIVENIALKKADHIIVVVEESMHRIEKKGINKNKISIISNTPDLKMLNKIMVKKSIFPGNRFNLLYTGFIDKGRGLEEVIEGISILKGKIPNIHLAIVGSGNYTEVLKIAVGKRYLEKHVSFLNWVDHQRIPQYIMSSDICIVPHIASEQMNTTIPNKLFDYMVYEKPVLVSDAIPLKRIVEEERCGMVFRSRDTKDFSSKVLAMMDEELRWSFGQRGFNAVKAKYNWEIDSRKLNELFSREISS